MFENHINFNNSYHIIDSEQVREFHHIVLSGLKEFFSRRSILSRRSSLSSDLGLDSFESCFFMSNKLPLNEYVQIDKRQPKHKPKNLTF